MEAQGKTREEGHMTSTFSRSTPCRNLSDLEALSPHFLVLSKCSYMA